MQHERVQREAEAYNEGDVLQESTRLQRRFWHVFECPNTLYLEDYFRKIIAQQTPGATVLDYGCYNGHFVDVLLQYHPKKVVGIDISDTGIAEAKAHFGQQADFFVMDAHKTDFEDNSFDFVVGRAILHHLDWETAITEIGRILKPGGYAAFIEPLGDNPMAKLLRYLTPKARTLDELPLSKSQIKQADHIIGGSHHRFGNLISVPLAMATSLIAKRPDNWLLKGTDVVDRLVASTPLKYWMRTVVLVWQKT